MQYIHVIYIYVFGFFPWFRCNYRTSKAYQSSIIQRLFGSDVELLSRCRCGKETKRESTTLLFNLEYPEVSEGEVTLNDTDKHWFLNANVFILTLVLVFYLKRWPKVASITTPTKTQLKQKIKFAFSDLLRDFSNSFSFSNMSERSKRESKIFLSYKTSNL